MAVLSEGPSRSDSALVAAFKAGDDSAATELVARHGTPLARFLYAMGAAAADVDDLIQEAFFRAFKSIATWRGEASFRSWLFRIGANLRKDLHRKQGGRIHVPIEDHEVVAPADPAGELGAAEMEQRLREGLAGLPRLQREVFLLRAQQGMEYEEICRTLGTTAGAARVHYHHAVKRLKELMT